MPELPKNVSAAWDEHDGPVILTTVDENGCPNAIYATCVSKYDNETLVVADNYFCKTRKNIQAGSPGSLLFITQEGKAFQVKGTIDYLTEGPIFDAMKTWNPEKHPGHAAAALKIESVYSGSEQLLG